MTRSKAKLLTPAESEIMDALWNLGQGTVREVAAALTKPLAYTTVLTMLRILETKGYVRHVAASEGGRAYVYLPRVPQEQARTWHLRDLCARLFGGKAATLVAGLIEDERLRPDELASLRRLIDSKLKKGESR